MPIEAILIRTSVHHNYNVRQCKFKNEYSENDAHLKLNNAMTCVVNDNTTFLYFYIYADMLWKV